MGIQAIYPKPRTTIRDATHKIYPYLLRDLSIERPDQVWATDITYLRLQAGFMYLIAIMDVFSRYVLSWELSNTLGRDFCIAALEAALKIATPEIMNSDHGVQFTSSDWIDILTQKGIKISMTGQGRCIDNVYPERLWRTLKYEDFYLRDYQTGWELQDGLNTYLTFYNNERYHQALDYKTPLAVYQSKPVNLVDNVYVLSNPLDSRIVPHKSTDSTITSLHEEFIYI
jgi:putative transposase